MPTSIGGPAEKKSGPALLVDSAIRMGLRDTTRFSPCVSPNSFRGSVYESHANPSCISRMLARWSDLAKRWISRSVARDHPHRA